MHDMYVTVSFSLDIVLCENILNKCGLQLIEIARENMVSRSTIISDYAVFV